MNETDNWLDRFALTQRSLQKKLVFWVALPMLIIGTVGLLWSLPIPREFATISPLLNWGSAFLMAAAVYYFIVSLSLAIGALPLLMGIAGLQIGLQHSEWPQFGLSLALLLSGLCGLTLGRSGRLSAVVQDCQLMMLGPLWLLSLIYKRLGIPV